MTKMSTEGEGGGLGRVFLVIVIGCGVAFLLGWGLRGRIDEWGMIALSLIILVLSPFIVRKLLRRGEP